MKEQTKYKKLLLQKNLALTEHKTKKQYSLKEFVRHISLNPDKLRKIEALLHGSFLSSKAGTGFDFNEIREYVIGDDLRHISWTATAKTGTLHTKEYFAEKEINSFFLVDISNSMFCGNKIEPFMQTFSFLLNLALSFSEKIGGLYFTNQINYYFSLDMANTQANIMFHTLLNYYYNLDKNLTSSPTATNISNALEFTKRYFTKKGFIFIISDFINLTNWERQLYELSQNQNVYSFQIYDSIDFSLPRSGYMLLIDPETKQQFFVNTDSKIIQKEYYSLMMQKQENLVNFLKTSGINHMILEKNDFIEVTL